MKVISSLQFGGAETQVISLSKELVKQGNRVLLVMLSDSNPRISELAGSNVEILVLDKKIKLDFFIIKKLYELIKNWRPDIIHGYLFDADLYVRLAACATHIPVVNSERNDNYDHNLNQKIANFLTSGLVNGVIANTYAGKEFSTKIYKHLNADRFHVVWNGIDVGHVRRKIAECKLSYKKDLFGDNSINLACMVASIKTQKDYVLALQVAKTLVDNHEKWRVIFLGDKLADGEDAYKNEVVGIYNNFDLELKEKIRFMGNRTDVIEILSQADVSFLTSHHEGFPNAVLESMSVGTPVVTTDFSDIGKISPRDWMVIGSRDSIDFANAINRSLKERECLSKESMRWVDDNCAINVISKKLTEIYHHFMQ